MNQVPYFQYLSSLQSIPEYDLILMAKQITDSISKQNSIWIIGNGGSASTAEHFETDLSFIRKSMPFPKLKVSALTSNSALITAIANDIGFENIFSHQLFRRAEPGDLCILISASGNSENLIRAVEACEEIGVKTLGLLGFDGGRLIDLVNTSILVKTDLGRYGPVEDVHLAICHEISSRVADNLTANYGSNK